MVDAATIASGMLNELLGLWHEHRSTLLFAAGALLLILRFARLTTKESQSSASKALHVLPVELSDPLQKREERQTGTAKPLDGSQLDRSPITPPKGKADGPKRFTGSRKTQAATSRLRTAIKIDFHVFYFSLGGSTTALVERLFANFEDSRSVLTEAPKLHNLVEIDFDDFFVSPTKSPRNVLPYYVLILPTYNIDSELNTFIDGLAETHNDFRIDTAPLGHLAGYSVFGIGDKEGWPTEEQGFCSQAVEVDRWMAKLTGRKRAFPVGMADVKSGTPAAMLEWLTGVMESMQNITAGRGLGEGVNGSGDALESDEENEDDSGSKGTASRARPTTSADTDLEDIRGPANVDDEIDFTTQAIAPVLPKEMVPENSPTYTALTKQGYTIVGSHSGVKLCRWTKSALRGRGSCYKFSFYGIKSHQCMETTPSLSCSNKCVFCWRHGTNPVSTTWRWTVDPPDQIFDGVKAGHYRKIKAMRGVPGVRAERFAEGMQIRHCALSLVGEPIFYPHINELLGMLHKEHISTFLVCNAQHPDQLAALCHVTQLYVSIDASNKDALKRIDRPLHRDFWERFLRCMDILREKRNTQRTVFRLTLVKGFNIEEEAEGYADLVDRARPALVEVKGVTYCGTSTSAAAGLTMQNVPFYEEVCSFVEALDRALAKRGLGYGIAAEHAHSCCILLAEKERFLKDDGWHTLIDYQKFFACLESGKEFGPQDYVGPPTPEWALWGNGGFDPRDERVDRKGRKKEGTVTVGGGRVLEL